MTDRLKRFQDWRNYGNDGGPCAWTAGPEVPPEAWPVVLGDQNWEQVTTTLYSWRAAPRS
jgi:hypothetical protein